MGEKHFRGAANTMKRVLILVEGQTEETFVRDLLAPHLVSYHVLATAVLLENKPRHKQKPAEKDLPGRTFKGGVSQYPLIERHILSLLNDKEAAVTTLLDYYGLPADFPGQETLPQAITAYQQVEHLQQAFAQKINHPRFHPYLALHEFEALLFCRPAAIAERFPTIPTLAAHVQAIRHEFSSPELINDEPQSHPSARLKLLIPRYRKPLDGVQIAQQIGLTPMREQCPHFASWLGWLENLNPTG